MLKKGLGFDSLLSLQLPLFQPLKVELTSQFSGDMMHGDLQADWMWLLPQIRLNKNNRITFYVTSCRDKLFICTPAPPSIPCTRH